MKSANSLVAVSCKSLLAVAILLSLRTKSQGQDVGVLAVEIGDINGDGRVSFSDPVLLQFWEQTGLGLYEPVEGSVPPSDSLPETVTPRPDAPMI